MQPTKIILVTGILTVRAHLYTWTRNRDMPSILGLLGALTALCRDLIVAACNQGRRQGHALERYDAVVEAAAVNAALSNAIASRVNLANYDEHRTLGLPANRAKRSFPLDPAVVVEQLYDELKLIESSVGGEFSFVSMLRSLYIFADAAYVIALEADRLAADTDFRRPVIGTLVCLTDQFRNRCNPC